MKSRSFGALKRLKSLYFVSAIAVPLLSGGAALAVAPSVSDYGSYYGSVQILKGNILPLDKDIFQLIYSDNYQKFIELARAYGKAGTVRYKLSESGTWSNRAPNLKSIGQHSVYYYVVGNSNYNDLGSEIDPEHVTVNIVDWGRKVEHNGIINYIDPTGKTSAEINKKGIIWVKVESCGKSSWYGIDNSSGFFENGSRFWVKWLSEESNPAEYQKYFEQLDDVHRRQLDQGNLRLFLTGVTGPDGTEYTKLPIRLPYYIQLDNDWDENNVHALIVSASQDRTIETQINTASYFINKYGGPAFPDSTGKYARLVWDCFAPCAVYNAINPENADGVDTSTSEKDIETEYGIIGGGGRYGDNNSYNDIIGDRIKLVDELNALSDDYGKHDSEEPQNDSNMNISSDSVKPLIIEIAIMILLGGVLGFIFKIIRKHRRGKDDNKNKSL